MNQPPLHSFQETAMATTFEIRIVHSDKTYAAQAAQAAFQRLRGIESLLSRFEEGSEISQVNRLIPGQILRLSLDTFACLHTAMEMHQLTGGAFDPGLGQEMDQVRGKSPSPASTKKGLRGQLLMDEVHFTVSPQGGGLSLDLGAIGKGFAIDRMSEVLAEWEISRALLISGGSSILAMEGPHEGSEEGWLISLSGHHDLSLRHRSISASGTSVKGAHILDPRSGRPAKGPFRSWALASQAAVSDALSTAWMLLDQEEIQEVCKRQEGIGAILQQSELDEKKLLFL